jgi:uncharacterized protein
MVQLAPGSTPDLSTQINSVAYRTQLEALLRQEARPADKFGHQPRLYALTRMVGEGLVYDDDVVFAAAYLHDLGVFIGHRPEEPELLSRWNHVVYTLDKAPAILAGIGFPADKIAAVLDAIRNHQPHDLASTKEAIILRDADILEQLGAIGILRAIAKVGRDNRYPTFTPAIAFLERNLESLPAQIRLESTRRLAAPRIELLRTFLDGVRSESLDHLH